MSPARSNVDAVRLAGFLPLVVPWVSADGSTNSSSMRTACYWTGRRRTSTPATSARRCTTRAAAGPRARRMDAAADAPGARPRRAASGHLPRLQETNVALGGTLHQAVQNVNSTIQDDHRAPPVPRRQVYSLASHDVRVLEGGLLKSSRRRHGAGELGAAGAQDPPARARQTRATGLVRPSRSRRHRANLCLQWHPGWRAQDNPVSMELLRAFRRRMPRLSRPAQQPKHARARPGPLGLAAHARCSRACADAGATPKKQQVKTKWTRANSISATSSELARQRHASPDRCLVPDLTGVARSKILPRENSPGPRHAAAQAVVAIGVTGRFPEGGPYMT